MAEALCSGRMGLLVISHLAPSTLMPFYSQQAPTFANVCSTKGMTLQSKKKEKKMNTVPLTNSSQYA